ncbi:Metallo-dependent phosphatase-like protein [Pisolithus marmoratus]|nr:Metallo-dependent phosphatase-like protein [Pisolithus marmoratus]
MWGRLVLAAAVLLRACVHSQAVNETDSPSCITESKGVHVPGTVPCNPYEPLQHHLAYAGPNGMTIESPEVYYGTSPFDLSSVATGYSVTYPTSRVYDNHVKITGLKPNTKYWATDTFVTARKAGDETPFSIAVVVDLGLMGRDGLSTSVGPLGGSSAAANPLGPRDLNTIQGLLQNKDTYEFIAHYGDIAYADYFIKESWQGYFGSDSLIPNVTSVVDGYNSLLEQYYDQMTPLTSSKPYMVGPGNHEANCDNGGTTDKVHNITYTTSICTPGQTNFTGYINHFRMPSDESGGNGNFWYSFDYGLAHFITLDSETDLPIQWLEKDLAGVDRNKTPWIIVGLHRPWYIAAQNDSGDVCLACQQAFEPLFLKYNIDLYMQGHVHLYERNKPIANYSIDPAGLNNPKAPWNIINGVAGHYDGLDTLEGSPYWSEVAFDTAYGWSRLTFHNRTHLTHEFVSSANGTVLDSAILYKAHDFHH